MSDEVAIQYRDVGKRFTYTKEQASSVLESILALGRNRANSETDLWAVRDVGFDVMRGESVGLIGRNGSGKSTLLKLTTRILKPTVGEVNVFGRISALLELGAGFHDDLTGRENVYLNGSVLGLSKAEIDARFDDILSFSELENFIDMPVKHYSSGMYMRLGFSVAVHCDPDILLVDEILSVGDAAFQRKCINHIMDLKQSGVTIIMVSHHADTIQKLCDKLVWLDKGNLQRIGKTDEVMGEYVRYMASVGAEDRPTTFARNGSYEAEITDVRFLNNDNESKQVFRTGDPMTIEMSYIAHQPIKDPEMGFAIFRDDGTHINGPNNRLVGFDIDQIEGVGKLRYQIKALPLMPGRYSVSAAIQDGHKPHAYDFHVQAYHFEIELESTPELHGIVALPATWEWLPEN